MSNNYTQASITFWMEDKATIRMDGPDDLSDTPFEFILRIGIGSSLSASLRAENRDEAKAMLNALERACTALRDGILKAENSQRSVENLAKVQCEERSACDPANDFNAEVQP